jgi:hypothetical protein
MTASITTLSKTQSDSQSDGIQYNFIRQNDNQHDNTQHNDIQQDNENMPELSIAKLG